MDLIEERTQYGVQKLKPGLTGWAQVNGRDEISLEQKFFWIENIWSFNRCFLILK